MPRNEQRRIFFSVHATERFGDRNITEDEARTVLLGGAWREDGAGRNGEPKWISEGSYLGKRVQVVFIEARQGGEPILKVLTVMD
jgi:hypothetical protein